MRRSENAVKRASGLWSRLAVFGLAVVVGIAGFVSTVSAEGGNVRYSYEEVEVADEPGYALVPRAEGDLTGDVTASTLEQAFESLRANKSQTYGNSYAVATGDDPEEATVEVHIDSNYEQYAPIIKAEAVYTMTEFGVPEVEFPDQTDQALTRADISVPAYTLTVPLWRVLPPERISSAQILMPDDELVSVEEIEQRWSRDRAGLVDEAYAFLDSGEPFTVQEVLRALPELADLRLDEVTDVLEFDNVDVRRTTLGVLEGHENESTALEAVSAALEEETNSGLAREMAEFLGRSDDDTYNVEQQFYLLAEGDDEEAEQAVAELSEWRGDDRVVETLADALRDDRQAVAVEAAESLEELDVHDPRIEALDDDEVSADVRLQMADDLADEANAESVRLAGLTHTARHREGGHAAQAIRTIAGLGLVEARHQVEEFLTDESRDRRRAAVDALVDRGDTDSIEALMEVADQQIDEEAMRDAAYEIMVSQSLDEIMDLTRADSGEVQEVAFRAIGQRVQEVGTSRPAVDTIEQGVDHHRAAIRAAAAESLGQIGTDDAVDTLVGMSDDSDPDVRRNVALALGEAATDEGSDVILEFLDDDDPRVVAAGIDAFEMRNDQRAADRIEEMINHDAPPVRASAWRAVTTFLPDHDDEEIVRSHIGELSGAVGDDAPEVQKTALEQLGRFQDEMAVTNIATLVGNEDPDIRITALEALAETDHRDARPLIESALGDQEPEVRQKAVEALTDLVGSEARPELEARMEQEDDPEVREAIESHLQQI